MRDPADRVTGELPELGPIPHPDACPACAGGMQPGRSCARCGRIEGPRRGMLTLAELLAQRAELQHKIDHPGRGRKRGQRVGAYRGAVKIGSINHAIRAQTGKSQAEFAKLAGISERTLRTWEQGKPGDGATSPETHRAIVAALHALGLDWAYLVGRTGRPRQPVRYRCPMTGSTWSGRGLMPRWLRVALDGGATLRDFQT